METNAITSAVIIGGYHVTQKIVDKFHEKWLEKNTKFIKKNKEEAE